ncbi:MAG: beta-hexosaminidase, partial [Paracoccaceae bacterium]|nr:beta-hexosaminidase [Paracoccaceae bacterium]
MIDLIRREIGFNGLLITDDLSMEALAGTLAERASASVKAGCDIALYCKAEMPDAEAVVAAAGTLTPTGQARAAKALSQRHAPRKIDIPALEAEFETLLNGQGHG